MPTRDDRHKIYQLIYVSGATQPMSGPELRSLANKSALSNQQLGITGLLLYHEQRFMQFLEGDIFSVGGKFEVIRNDPRHHGVYVLRRRFVVQRQFPDWSMRLAEPDEISERSSEIYDRLFNGADTDVPLRQDAAETWAILNAFHYS